ncbi:MAG: glycosyltransferase family 39 protein [Chloroflexota bacterium]
MAIVSEPPQARPADAASVPAGSLCQKSKGRWHLLLVGGVLLLALIARFWGLLYGLPHSYYPDESSVVGDALQMARTGDLRPEQFLWPTFWIYVVAASVKAGLVFAALPGGLGPLGTPSLDNMLYVYGVARTVTALAGVVTILVLHAAAARWFSLLNVPGARWYALLAAGFLALSPLHIQHSHVTSPDVPTTAFLVVALYFVVRMLECRSARWYLLAGLALGLSTAAKYPSAMFAVAIVVAHLAGAGLALRRPRSLVVALLDWRLWLAGGVTVMVFFATSPYILIDWSRFQEDFVSQASRVLQRGPVGEVGVSGPFAPMLYVPLALNWGLDTPVALLALMGLGAALWMLAQPPEPAARVRWNLLTVLAFPVLLYVFSWTWQHRFARYALPLVPFGCLLAAFGLARMMALARRVAPLIASSPGRLVPALLGLSVMLWQADGVVRYDVLLTRPDTRTIAANWLSENLPPGEQVIVEWYGPPYGNVRQMGFDLSDRSLDRYFGRTPRFIVTSSFTYDRWLRTPDLFPKREAFYSGLHERGTLIYEVRPFPELEYDPVQEGWDGWHGIPLGPDARPGPVLRVYQVTP